MTVRVHLKDDVVTVEGATSWEVEDGALYVTAADRIRLVCAAGQWSHMTIGDES